MSFQIYFRDEIHERERIKVSVSNSEEEFRNTTVEELKRKLIPEDQYHNTILVYYFNTLKKNRTLGSYGIKHEDEIRAVRRGSTFTETVEFHSFPAQVTEETFTFEDDDDEDKEISRTQSIDNLALMQQIDHQYSFT